MKHIFNILKKHVITIIFIITVLFIQAMCELSLPDYTSKIVDIGIRQNGIEDNVLEIVRKEEYKKIQLFLSEEEKKVLNTYYTLEENNYKLNDITIEQRKEISKILYEPEKIIYLISEESTSNEILKRNNVKNIDELYKKLSKMSYEERNEFVTKNVKKLEQDKLEIEYVKKEYKENNYIIETIQNKYIKKAGIKMLALALLAALSAIIVSYLSSRLAAKFSKKLRKDVVEKVMSYSNKEFKEISTASLITRSTNDINRIQMFITMLLRIAIFAPLMGIGALLKVIGNPMSYIIAIAVFIILILIIILFTIAIPKFKKVQELVDKVNLIFREILNGLPVIRSFANEKHEEKRFDEANLELKKVNLFVDRIMTIMMPTMTLIMNLVCLLIIWVGANKIENNPIGIGTLMAFIQYTMQIIMSFLMISMISIMIPRAWVSIKRIAEILNKKSTILDKENPKENIKFKGEIEFKDVYFRYHDANEDILEDISFKAKPGEVTAIIGSTGSGKSTLVNLIPRFFDVTGGKILIDNIDIRNIKLKELRNIIGFVPQKGYLFSGTIKSNIAFGKEKIDNKKIKKAALISQSEEFIESKNEKYDSEISQGGTNVSGGQKQRLSIARALYNNPLIYIFDDSFSALDYKTDKKLRKALKNDTNKATIIIVAQRISTVLNADQIIVLDEGKIVGIGRHEDLIKNCSVYQEIALSQVTKEELENGK